VRKHQERDIVEEGGEVQTVHSPGVRPTAYPINNET